MFSQICLEIFVDMSEEHFDLVSRHDSGESVVELEHVTADLLEFRRRDDSFHVPHSETVGCVVVDDTDQFGGYFVHVIPVFVLDLFKVPKKRLSIFRQYSVHLIVHERNKPTN